MRSSLQELGLKLVPPLGMLGDELVQVGHPGELPRECWIYPLWRAGGCKSTAKALNWGCFTPLLAIPNSQGLQASGGVFIPTSLLPRRSNRSLWLHEEALEALEVKLQMFYIPFFQG